MIHQKWQYFIVKWGIKFGSFFFLSFVLYFVFTPNVLAYTFSTVGNITNYTSVQVSPDYSNQPIVVPVNSSYNLREVRQVDIFINNYTLSANTTYQLELVLTDQTLEFANTYGIYGLNGEICTSDASANLSSGYWVYVSFSCPHATDSLTIFLKNFQNSYLWNGNGIFSWERATLRSAPEPLNGSPSDSENIINNQNSNTQSIIDNNNRNTQSIIDSNKVCENIDKANIIDNGKGLTINGGVFNSSSYGITNYIKINKNSEIKVLQNFAYHAYCYYTTNKELISCANNSDLVVGSLLTIPSNADYVRFTIHNTQNKPTFELCKNGNQSLDDSLNDDDVGDATNEASDFFSDFDTDTFGLTSIITAPLNLIQSLTSSSCATLHLPLPYLDNKYLDLPCMSDIYSSTFGSFFTMYQTITFGIIAYWVCVRIFNMVKDFKNPEHDEIEVVDL